MLLSRHDYFGVGGHAADRVFGLLVACGYLVTARIARYSVLLRKGGRVTGKGRTYDFHAKSSSRRS